LRRTLSTLPTGTADSRSHEICAPWIWSFLLCHRNFDFLRDHQRSLL